MTKMTPETDRDRLATAIAEAIMADANLIERVGVRSGALPLIGDHPERLSSYDVRLIVRAILTAEEGAE